MLPEKISAARLALARRRPYVSAALWALQPVERPGLGTLAVDRWWRLYYDPATVQEWSVEELTGVLYHEIWHLLRGHPERATTISAEPMAWNIAADAEINDDILGETNALNLPKGVVTPEAMGWDPNLLAEQYYELLKRQGEQGGQNKQHGPGERPLSGQEPPKPGRSGRSCGSCAHGRQEAWEEGEPGEGKTPGIREAQAEAIRRKVAQEILEAAKRRGDIPGSVKRWAEEKLGPPKVDWRRELAASVRWAVASQSGATDYTRSRPNRRQAAYGSVLMPALCRPTPEVAVVVDTSGSMEDGLLTQALAELKGVLQSLGGRTATVLAVDATVQSCGRVFRPEQVHLAGGGGTDMRVGIEAALERRPRPQVVVVLTDGLTPWPETAPQGVRVVVGLIGEERGEAPEWARVVEIGG